MSDTAIVWSSSNFALQADMEAGVDNTKEISPDLLVYSLYLYNSSLVPDTLPS